MLTLVYIGLTLLELVVIVRALLRPHRDPTARIAWVVVIGALPIIGIIAYLYLGETSVGEQRSRRVRAVLDRMPPVAGLAPAELANLSADVPARYAPLFRVGESISGFPPFGGNSGRLFSNSDETIDAIVADIDAATEHVHLLFYIWLTDNNGVKVVEALKRAAARGVRCRALADNLGSRAMIASEHWSAMQAVGVHVAFALPIKKTSLRPSKARLDLRNHRKIVVIDNWITYCGSQNCADAEFRVKPEFAPWVDAMIRFEGPIARQNQFLWASDWMTDVDEDVRDLLNTPLRTQTDGFPAQVIGTGPTVRNSAMPEMFESMMFAATREIVITSPYYVPTDSIQGGLCAAANRGVKTTIIFPKRNDSPLVAAASRSYYKDLLEAGVEIHEYVGGLLHTKSMTIDGEMTLIGSANMDRRSFELNYENNILFYDPELCADVRRLQESYLSNSVPVELEVVSGWSMPHQLWNNVNALLGPLL